MELAKLLVQCSSATQHQQLLQDLLTTAFQQLETRLAAKLSYLYGRHCWHRKTLHQDKSQSSVCYVRRLLLQHEKQNKKYLSASYDVADPKNIPATGTQQQWSVCCGVAVRALSLGACSRRWLSMGLCGNTCRTESLQAAEATTIAAQDTHTVPSTGATDTWRHVHCTCSSTLTVCMKAYF